HFPDSSATLARAQERLRFDEFFFIQLRNQMSRQELAAAAASAIPFAADLMKDFLGRLPYQLTQCQRRSAWEIIQDLGRAHPMSRLLDGDVGSGKTIVAAAAARQVASAGQQTVIMAPTEILAWQHYQSFSRLFVDTGVTVGVYTRTYRHITTRTEPITKALLLSQLRRGAIQILIGTHAVIQEAVVFQRLGLAIVDEQHRFGVEQRQALQQMSPSGLIPHFLSMTATPIPRSLALTLYGDLDISLLDELPAGRQPIKTAVVLPSQRAELYRTVDAELAAGRQAFIICPLIDPSPTVASAAVKTEYERLGREVFPHRRLGLLHGKLTSSEKDRVMAAFVAGEIDVLVATSVIEVGVDVPNATMMLIEGAERFGLAQLHQFRGRVGRGAHQSYCWLLTDAAGAESGQRLAAVVKSQDGFSLAEQDLKLRGPGDVLGSNQSGFPELKFATLFDVKNIKRAKMAALAVLAADPQLNHHPLLRQRVGKWDRVHWE
ncbi:MAG: ATP-dependent DNA helicase RecG, partial [Patescibacteria group bacterium]